jgi:hypothetical protein
MLRAASPKNESDEKPVAILVPTNGTPYTLLILQLIVFRAENPLCFSCKAGGHSTLGSVGGAKTQESTVASTLVNDSEVRR